MHSIFYVAIVVAVATAEDLSQGTEGLNMENSMGYTFSSVVDQGGKPSGQAYAFVGGKLTPVPPQPTYYQAEPNIPTSILPPQPSSTTMISNLTTVSYFAAGVVAALSIWYLCSFIALPHAKKSIEEFKDEGKPSSALSTDSTEKKEEKSRRRRSIRKSDEEMTQLANIVLSAVQSGECLQKSICLLGAQMAGKKGRMADSLLNTLLPPSIRQSDYYIILKRSIRGELSCEKLGCNNH